MSRNKSQGIPRFAVIGAGPSGLAISLFLKNKPIVLESNNHVGGHASSFVFREFTFDYGPHILFSRDQEILDFIVMSLEDNLSRCKRNNKIFYKNRLLKYPFENNLHALDLDDNYDCIKHFIFNPYKEKYIKPNNMKEWFLKTFGEGICSRYLFPYNEKVWNLPVEKLSLCMAERIPNPPPEDILKSSLGYNTEGYLHQLYYYYPLQGGYQSICEAWKKAVKIIYQFKVEKVQCANGKIILADGQGNCKEFDQVISTMPMHELIYKMDCPIPEEILQAVESLIVNPMIIVSFGIQGIDKNQYTAVYFPDADFWVNRVSYPCTFSELNAPKNHWSLQAEITCSKNSVIWDKSDEEIIKHVKQGLRLRNLLPEDNKILFALVNRQERSYVVYDNGYEKNADKVRRWFSEKGIHLLGRFGYFEYINVDMAVDRAIKLAAFINGDIENPAQIKSAYLKNALTSLSANGESL